MRIPLAAAFAAVSLGAQAQDAAPKSADAQTPPPERKELNLRLDEPRGRGTMMFGPAAAPREPSSGLPTLGDDARRIEPPKPSEAGRGSPYPKGSGPQQDPNQIR